MDEMSSSGDKLEVNGVGKVLTCRHKSIRRLSVLAGTGLVCFVLTVFSLWCIGVIGYLFPFVPSIAGWICLLVLIISAVCFFKGKWKAASAATASLIYLLALILWFSTKPSNDKQWQAPWARMPEVTVKGNEVTVNNVRDFIYKTEKVYL